MTSHIAFTVKDHLKPEPLTIPKTRAYTSPSQRSSPTPICSDEERLSTGPESSVSPLSTQRLSPESDILDYYYDNDDNDTASSEEGSSCYSRRSSLTSMESEYPGGAYKSADAFSIGSPVALGVFDEGEEPVQRASQRPSVADLKNKPLPHEPPIALAPLQVRRPVSNCPPASSSSSAHRPRRPRIDAAPPAAKEGLVLRPSVAQAAADLENALKACTTAAQPVSVPEERSALPAALDAPLQISRGAMQMNPSRPAPRPPAHIVPYSLQRSLLPHPHQKKGKKMPFHLTVPGLGRKLHLRSFSSSNMRSEMETSDRGLHQQHPNKEAKNKDRPSSFSSERELRLLLPRLQTKKMEPVGCLEGALAAMTATATATTISLNTNASSTSSSSNRHSLPSASSNSLDSHLEPTVGGPVKPVDYDEKIFVASSKMRRNNTYVLPYQPGSLQAPEIIYELDSMPASAVRVEVFPSSPSSPAPLPLSTSSSTVAWPAGMPDQAVRSILEQTASLDDLFSLAIVNRQFYRIFKRHELDLIKGAVFKMSPPAWELREMSPPWDTEFQLLLDPDAQVPDYTPTLYLQRYAQDIFTLAQLKSLILARCGSFLRPDTIRGLAGADPERATAVDDAFWRVWTFCRIFGCGKGRENDIAGQMDWMNGGVQAMNHQHHPLLSLSVTEPFGMNNVLFEPPAGFAMGNLGGLSQSQMYDMTELFTCLSVLLQPIHGKCHEARTAGLYKGFDVKCGDHDKEEKLLEEWTAYVLTLGLSAVLCLGSICPIKDATTTFQKAHDMGLTKWDLYDSEITRSSFLKEAVSKTYKSREDAFAAWSQQSVHSSAASTNSSRSSFVAQDPRPGTSDLQPPPQQPPLQEHRVRQAAFAAELRNQRSQPRMNASGTSFSDERPISSYTVVMNGLDGIPQQQQQQQQQQRAPPVPAIPRFQPTQWSAPVNGPVGGPVLDPVDRAIDMMVRELGFRDTEAKWALRTTDTGEGVDVNAAVALLVREREASASAARGLGTINEETGWRWA